MRITYHPGEFLAYIGLREIAPGEASHSYELEEGDVVADFDKDKEFLGLELLGSNAARMGDNLETIEIHNYATGETIVLKTGIKWAKST